MAQRGVSPSSACSTNASLITGEEVNATHCSMTDQRWRTLPAPACRHQPFHCISRKAREQTVYAAVPTVWR
ncbi:hypothetical protein KCP74_12260 [Salmonella enterica subsp. enterica]|nr:hypothetical protein KCP74_12260 [Salmonella enterica subsp. enterica]